MQLARTSAWRGERFRRRQRSQYILHDRDRSDDRGLTDAGLGSSISNLFVSAVILTDKQSACNLTSPLTECDSVSTRGEKMALSLLALRVVWEQAEINLKTT